MTIFFHFHNLVFGKGEIYLGFGSIFADDGAGSVFVRISVGWENFPDTNVMFPFL
jgi:hypothetical protein